MKKGDVAVIGVILLAAVLLFIVPARRNAASLTAIVVQNGDIIHEINLSAVTTSYELDINGGRLLVEPERISYIDADCPDKKCISMGILDKAGDMAVCVPQKTCVYIKGVYESVNDGTYTRGSDVDAVTY